MGPNLKFSAVFAGSAFAVASVTGLIAGVGFGTLLVRAVLGALVFGGLGYGSYILISTRLPELLTQSSGPSSEDTSAASGYGQNVDIVVDDESEGGGEDTAGGEAADLEEVEEPLEAPHAPETAEQSQPAEPVEEPQAAEAAASGDDSLVEEVEEASEAAPEAQNPAAGDEDMEENSVDTLPDIGSFADDFESEGNEVVENEEQNKTGGGERASGNGVQQDPEVIAKALQTVMKRDE